MPALVAVIPLPQGFARRLACPSVIFPAGEFHRQAQPAARAGVAAWIEDYNTTRKHSALGMRSPLAYEQALAAGKAA